MLAGVVGVKAKGNLACYGTRGNSAGNRGNKSRACQPWLREAIIKEKDLKDGVENLIIQADMKETKKPAEWNVMETMGGGVKLAVEI